MRLKYRKIKLTLDTSFDDQKVCNEEMRICIENIINNVKNIKIVKQCRHEDCKKTTAECHFK